MKIGILLTNTGTPDAPTARAVRRYLREFLSDKRVVHLPRFIWLPILYGLVLPTRSSKSAALYQKIWTEDGSPMRAIMKNLQQKLASQFSDNVEIGMNYGTESISQAMENLRQKKIDKIIVLPLYPQYSNTTTASSFDRVTHALKKWPALPETHFIRDYATHPDYIRGLANSLRHAWAEKKPAQHLLISFHGIPKRFVAVGDPYQTQCEQTAQLLATELQLQPDQWTLCYQSQFGYDKWLTPSTQQLFLELPKRGIKTIDVICPGFAIDCLETLEEIAIRGQETFHQAGGESLRYIPALNDSQQQIELLSSVIASASPLM